MLTCQQVKDLENRAFQSGISADALMEKAGLGLANLIQQFFPTPGHCILFCGKGNNAGDVLVAGRHLITYGWHISLHLCFPLDQLSPLAQEKLKQLQTGDLSAKKEPKLDSKKDEELYHKLPIQDLKSKIQRPTVLLDGLLGIGASGEPRAPISDAIRRMNALRQEGAYVVAADIPSGLDPNTGQPSACCVQADITATIAIPKTGLLADTATNYVGRLALIPLQELEVENEKRKKEEKKGPNGSAEIAIPSKLRKWLPPRHFDSHKGTYGRLGIVAGSRGFLGAARLTSLGGLHGGAGLITLYVTEDIYPFLATSITPEVMVKPITSYLSILDDRHDALAIGPGLGTAYAEEICKLIHQATCPAVIDADALNCLAKLQRDKKEKNGREKKQTKPSSDFLKPHSALHSLLRTPHSALVLTPHPGEMACLYPEHPADRRSTAETFACAHDVTVLLKGARTIITSPNQPTLFNTTGSPGMGTGGMGDILTGLIGALLAQHVATYQAAILGAWLAGRAAEIAITHNQSEQSLSACHIAENLGLAFHDLRNGCY